MNIFSEYMREILAIFDKSVADKHLSWIHEENERRKKMRVLYKNGTRVESDFVDHEGKTFTSALLCPMAWSQIQNGCTILCAFYEEEEVGINRQLNARCNGVRCVLGRIEKSRPL